MSSSFFKKSAVIFGWCLWVAGSFFAAQLLVGLIYQLLLISRLLPLENYNQTLVTLVVLAAAYVLALILVVGVPLLVGIGHTKAASIKKHLAIDSKPRFTQLLLSLPGYVVYFGLTIVFSFVLQQFWPGFDANQAQQVGFKNLSGPLEFIMAFFALAIIPPLMEEMLFRGYLFSHVRRKTNFWVSALLVSAVFGLAHGQLNVGIDVFALSLVLCFLREKTGSIWTGVALHLIKNSIAFSVLFLRPDILKLLTGA